MWSLRRWRRERRAARAPLPEALWRQALAGAGFLGHLSGDQRARLRALVTMFLHEKTLSAAGGLTLTDPMRVSIALQACVLVLELGIDWYDDWVEVVVYPDEFVVPKEYQDEYGVTHRVVEPLAGEAWPGGPVVLSWQDVDRGTAGDGCNVVIHEFAHKLDMRNGDANGMPPLHPDMNRSDWSAAFGAAYQDFCERVDRGEDTALDPYAAEDPGEFFAVASEAFFEMPRSLHADYPAVYAQLEKFYRQHPLGARQ
jgi:Mlc titration factor MtfA (ptsG expression regulator)